MSHEAKGKSDEWYTPKYIFDALDVEFDMDVAAPYPPSNLHVPAKNWIHSDSLNSEWRGFVWMNPPYGNQKMKMQWIKKFIDHGNGIALMPDRTNAMWWQELASNSDLILFTFDKIKFERPDGSVGESPSNGSTLFAIGDIGVKALLNASVNELGLLFNNFE